MKKNRFGTIALVGAIALAAYVFFTSGMGGGWGPGRDAFPVFDDPEMLSGAEAEAQGLIFPRDAVIGVAYGGEAKAYPLTIMGVHELGNDTIGGIPIAVSW